MNTWQSSQVLSLRPHKALTQDPSTSPKTPIQVPQATLLPVLKDSFLAPGGSANFLLSSGRKGPPDPHRWQSPESSPFHSSSSLFSYYIFILRISITWVDVTCFMAQIENQIRNHSSYLRTYSCLWGNDSWGKQGWMVKECYPVLVLTDNDETHFSIATEQTELSCIMHLLCGQLSHSTMEMLSSKTLKATLEN